MLNVTQFRANVVRPALDALATVKPAMDSPEAEDLLMGTAVQESSLIYLRQLSGGPGMGIFQIEPSTHDDVWTNYLDFRPDMAATLNSLAAGGKGTSAQLPWNLAYSAAIARLIYWRAPPPCPQPAKACTGWRHFGRRTTTPHPVPARPNNGSTITTPTSSRRANKKTPRLLAGAFDWWAL